MDKLANYCEAVVKINKNYTLSEDETTTMLTELNSKFNAIEYFEETYPKVGDLLATVNKSFNHTKQLDNLEEMLEGVLDIRSSLDILRIYYNCNIISLTAQKIIDNYEEDLEDLYDAIMFLEYRYNNIKIIVMKKYGDMSPPISDNILEHISVIKNT